MAYHN